MGNGSLDRNVKEVTMSTHPTDHDLEDMPQRTMRAGAPLPVRIVLVACAVLLAGCAVLGAINLSAVGTYNTASAQLADNVHEAAADDVDLPSLLAKQRQVDLELQSAYAMHGVLLPSVRTSIEDNTKVSRALTQKLQDAIKQQQPNSDKDASQSSGESALSAEQQEQIQQMLQSNGPTASQEPLSSDYATSDDGATTSTNQSTAKPW